MTGFGESSNTVDGVHYAVEVRSLNNKFLKAVIRIPDELQGLEPTIDSALRSRLTRGSVTVTLRYSDTTSSAAYEINTEALQTYLDRVLSLSTNKNGKTIDVDLSSLLSLPGVLQPPANLEHRVERVRPIVEQLLSEACHRLIDMRAREGVLLHEDLHKHRDAIQKRLDRISERSPVVIEEYHQRLKLRVERMLQEVKATVDDGDLVREVAIYAERSDISEEIARLSAHLKQFQDLIDSDDLEPVGRTLDFLAQEMLREANTIASKCNDAAISRDIVEVKGAIDRIKEQVQNVE
ncbi:MAG: YicC/YloC family endoribonuclease [Planctomycetota bacterium]